MLHFDHGRRTDGLLSLLGLSSPAAGGLLHGLHGLRLHGTSKSSFESRELEQAGMPGSCARDATREPASRVLQTRRLERSTDEVLQLTSECPLVEQCARRRILPALIPACSPSSIDQVSEPVVACPFDGTVPSVVSIDAELRSSPLRA